MRSLRACFDRHKCDRGFRHGYERVYEPLFAMIRNQPLRILEIGVWRGAGIWAWLDYFPRAVITGMDTFQRVPPEQVEVLKHERVNWLEADSTLETIGREIVLDDGIYDIIIDDGDHRAHSQRETFLNMYPLLKRGGMYFIEDVWPMGPGYADLVAALPDPIHHKLGQPDSYILQC